MAYDPAPILATMGVQVFLDYIRVNGLPASWLTADVQVSLGKADVANPMTTAGDTIYGGASGVPTRLAKGTTGQVLTQGATNPAWGDSNPMTTSGDIIYGGASGVQTRLPKGTDGYVLTQASGIPSWAALASPWPAAIPTGLGGVAQLTGPTDQAFLITSGLSGSTPKNITIKPVDGGSGNAGGTLTLTGGVSTSTSGGAGGGPVTIAGGSAAGTSAGGAPTGGAASVTGGASGTYTSASGGAASLTGGVSNGATGTAGQANVTGGAGNVAGAAGGSASLKGGAGNTTGVGAAATVAGGAGGTSSVGGAVSVTGGLGGSTSGNSGDVTVGGGAAPAGSGRAGLAIIGTGFAWGKQRHPTDGAAFSITAADFFVYSAPGAASRVVSLPAISAVPTGTVYVIKSMTKSATNQLTVTAAGSDTIEGAATLAVGNVTVFESIMIVSDGTSDWKAIAAFSGL